MTTDRLERSAAFWLRAYPPSWRAERAAEVTAVLRHLAGPDARRLDVRTALGLLRGGVATRWRRTPPPWVYLPYRMLDIRVPARYREWVHQDLTSPGYQRRSFLGRVWMFLLPLYQAFTTDLRHEILLTWTAIGVAGVATVLCVRPEGAVRRRLQHHTRLGPDEPRELGSFVWVRTARARIAADSGSRVLLLLLAVGAGGWSIAALMAPSRLVLTSLPCDFPSSGPCVAINSAVVSRTLSPVVAAPLVAAVVVGALLALAVRRRLDRRLPARPAQPHRLLLALRPQARVGVALWIGLIAAAVLAEATGAWVFAVSAVAGPVCLLLLPSAVVLRRRARATPDAAFVDLWRVAWTGRPIAVDRSDSELVPRVGPGGPMTVDPRFERSVHRWLRAYPRRWRRERADEVTALLADLAAPDATRVDARTAASLLRAGWATRLRTRPPLRHALAYRLLDRRVPARYRGWVRDDLESEGSPVRVLVSVAAVVAIVSVVIPVVTGGRPHAPSAGGVAVLLGMSIGLLARGPQIVRKRARKHLVPDDGEELTSETLLFGWVLRDRLTARGSTGLGALGLAVAAAAAVTACLVAPTTLGAGSCGTACVETVTADRVGFPAPLVVVLVVALALGVLAALRARLMLRRLVDRRPPQHSRRLVRPTPRHRMIVVTATVCAVGIAWIEGTGRADLFLTVAIAVAALVTLPGMLVAWWAARTGPDDLALVDVLTIAAQARLPRVDSFAEGLVPAVLATD